jgi:hypothetical protein
VATPLHIIGHPFPGAPMHHLDHKIKREGKKKLLTLDGGGIRGIMTVQILAGLEVEGFLR